MKTLLACAAALLVLCYVLAHRHHAPLPVIAVDDLEAALLAVTAAGASIVRPIFAFPGGRRFQFLDPHGNELAVMQAG